MGSKNEKPSVPLSVVLDEQLSSDPTPRIGLSHVAAFDAMDAILEEVAPPPADWTSVAPVEVSPVGEDELEAIDDSTSTAVFSEETGPKERAIKRRRMARKLDGMGKLVKDPEHGNVTVKTVIRDGNVVDNKPPLPDGVAIRLGVREGDHARRAMQAVTLESKIPSERSEAEEGEALREFLKAFAQDHSNGIMGKVDEPEAVVGSARGTEHAPLVDLIGEPLQMEGGLLELWSAFGDRISSLGELTTGEVNRDLFRISPILDKDRKVIALAAIADKPEHPLVIKPLDLDAEFRLSYCATGDCDWPTPIEPMAPHTFSSGEIIWAMRGAEAPNLFAHLVDDPS